LTTSTTSPAGIMDRLKHETAEHHARAEGKDLQRSMIRGQLTRERYAAFLAQMLHVHLALEDAINSARARDARVGVVPAEQHHSGRIREDLRFYAAPESVPALPATHALISRIRDIAAADPMAVLGLHYVLEGSMNGNRYIAMALRRAFGLSPGQGDRYLDPYGEQQRPKWIAFRAEVDRLPWSESEAAAAVEAAKAMFDGIAAISDAV
jgi:heme oxygenase